jgi:hypothetical protein
MTSQTTSSSNPASDPAPLPMLLTVPKAAQLLGISWAAPYRLAASGELPVRRLTASHRARGRADHPARRGPRLRRRRPATPSSDDGGRSGTEARTYRARVSYNSLAMEFRRLIERISP